MHFHSVSTSLVISVCSQVEHINVIIDQCSLQLVAWTPCGKKSINFGLKSFKTSYLVLVRHAAVSSGTDRIPGGLARWLNVNVNWNMKIKVETIRGRDPTEMQTVRTPQRVLISDSDDTAALWCVMQMCLLWRCITAHRVSSKCFRVPHMRYGRTWQNGGVLCKHPINRTDKLKFSRPTVSSQIWGSSSWNFPSHNFGCCSVIDLFCKINKRTISLVFLWLWHFAKEIYMRLH